MRLDLTDEEAAAILWLIRHGRGWPQCLDFDSALAHLDVRDQVGQRLERGLAGADG